MAPHNMTMCVTGTGMLWVGWYGFNGGSELAANGSAAMAIAVTMFGAMAVLTWKVTVLGLISVVAANIVYAILVAVYLFQVSREFNFIGFLLASRG